MSSYSASAAGAPVPSISPSTSPLTSPSAFLLTAPLPAAVRPAQLRYLLRHAQGLPLGGVFLQITPALAGESLASSRRRRWQTEQVHTICAGHVLQVHALQVRTVTVNLVYLLSQDESFWLPNPGVTILLNKTDKFYFPNF